MSTNISAKPIIGIICCRKDIQGQPGQAVHDKYIDSIQIFGGTPVLLPEQVVKSNNLEAVLKNLDGILLTGSYSNVAPHRYNATHEEQKTDETRDELSFSLLDYAVKNNMPVFGICRGLQEINTYFGGTLYPDLTVNPQFTEKHSENTNDPIEVQYGPAHGLEVRDDSKIAELGNYFDVNSLHKQAIKELAPPLKIEATAPDGLIEAVSHTEHPFLFAVQWHPEWKPQENELSTFLFSKFIEQSYGYHQSKK